MTPGFTCLVCGEYKPPTEAHIGTDGMLTLCKSCVLAECRKRYLEICPVAYQKTQVKLLPQAAQRRLSAVMDWNPGPHGLMLWGPVSGAGKTRCAWLLIKRLMCQDGIGVVAFDCVGFAHEMERRYREDEDVVTWLDRLARAPVLFLDDITRSKWTERVMAELFGLIDRRCAHELPIIATMNESGSELEQRKGAERWAIPIVRRLRESCTTLEF